MALEMMLEGEIKVNGVKGGGESWRERPKEQRRGSLVAEDAHAKFNEELDVWNGGVHGFAKNHGGDLRIISRSFSVSSWICTNESPT